MTPPKQSNGSFTVEQTLKRLKVKYTKEHRFPDCKLKRSLPFDFYLPLHDICIEYDGIQHAKSSKFHQWMTESQAESRFEQQKQRDAIKTTYCKDNNIPLLRIPHTTLKRTFDELITKFLVNHPVCVVEGGVMEWFT